MIIDETKRYRLYENGNITVTSWGSGYFVKDKDNYINNETANKVENGKKKKTYSIDSRNYRRISSSAVKLWNKRKNKVIFLTLTFPFDVSARNANKCFSKFIENLKLNYHLNSYLATRELQKNNRSHFHIIADIPFIDVKKLQGAWNKTYREFSPPVPNSLRLGSPEYGTIVKNCKQLVNYICKYCAKSKNFKYTYSARCFFVSHNIVSNPVDIDYFDFLDLIEEFKTNFRRYRFSTVVILYNTPLKQSFLNCFFTENFQKSLEFM